ncbi:GntR family transcriptional regulator [Bradyrhizobium canariense]|uniref:DNA-binding transcriptional regulator, GntR family n=1 Tax=Bradyrhizobium canariense TaxID=255045 RepID=A0A1H2AKN7_9BRAD|nr:GntR family transcriptional regulator [Bradyrhizobium canariense]SDT46480.1 DNA-binding transcriptional regulator, GntR family [Bradyrhizobium canariense]
MTLMPGSLMRRLGQDQFSLHDRVVAELRQAILSGRLRPGERLVEERLADELGVSRNPVREAIRALASEGLVNVTARRGATVATMTEQEARETIEVRALLEGQNARLAARRGDKQIIKRIEAILNKGTAAVASKRFDQLFDLNQKFHSELAAAGQNTVLGDLLQKFRERTAMLFAPMDPSRQARTWEEHAAILRAIIDGDERTSATLAAEHVMRAGMDFLVGLNAGDGPLMLLGERKEAPTQQRPSKQVVPPATKNAAPNRKGPSQSKRKARA